MKKIIRRPDRAEGGVTDDELAAMAEHVKLWTARAFRTEPIEPDKIVPAIHGMYAAAGLKAPRVVIVPSPIVMAFAGVISDVWWSHKAAHVATIAATIAATRAATYDATRAATDAATYGATRAATIAATYAATGAATIAATYDATRAATDAATYGATRAATIAATYAATDDATDAATDAATDDDWIRSLADRFLGDRAKIAIDLLPQWHVPYQGGNMWAAWDCYLTACRDMLGLRLPCHEKYAHWEQAAIHGGFRYMHSEFCLVSDFPERILIDDRNLPHCEDGPSHRWRDGWSLWHWHGVAVPQHVIERPETIKIAEIKSEKNAEVKRIMIERFGWPKYLAATNAKVVHARRNDVDLCDEALMQDGDGGRHLICACPSTARVYAMRVPREIASCEQAQKWLAGDRDVNVIVSS